MKRTENIKGFTIIEVVLVLAIAGLIFLMVFIALPALQSGQRDTARKADVSAVAAAVNSYSSNNKGAFPASALVIAKQMGSSAAVGTATVPLVGVSGNTSTIAVATIPAAATATSAANVTAADAAVTVIQKATCDVVGPTGVVGVKLGSSRQYAVITRLEGGNNTGYCLQN